MGELPLRAPERVQERHGLIVRMRDDGALLKQIGHAVGLNHSSVLYHLNGKCRCSHNGTEPIIGTYYACGCCARPIWHETKRIVLQVWSGQELLSSVTLHPRCALHQLRREVEP